MTLGDCKEPRDRANNNNQSPKGVTEPDRHFASYRLGKKSMLWSMSLRWVGFAIRPNYG